MVNAPLGGRRPLSSTCPSVIVDNNGDVKMVIGGSGGTRITLSTAWVRHCFSFEIHFFFIFFSGLTYIPFQASKILTLRKLFHGRVKD